MSLFIQKLISILLEPITLSFFLIIFSLLFSLFKRKVLARLLLVSGIAWTMVLSLPVVGNNLLHSLESQYPIEDIDQLPNAEAIVLLGGAIAPTNVKHNFANFNASADRPIHAARIYHLNKAPRLLISAGSLPWKNYKKQEAEITADLLKKLGVTESAIIEEDQSATTYENAVYTKKLLEPLGIKRIILVTSARHMRRAEATFLKAGFDVIPAATDYYTPVPPKNSLMHWIPRLGALKSASIFIKETVGYWVYKYRGWI